MNFIKRVPTSTTIIRTTTATTSTTTYLNSNINSCNKILFNFYSNKRIIKKPSTISYENENHSNPIKRNTKIKNRSSFREVEFENEKDIKRYSKFDDFDDLDDDNFDDNDEQPTKTNNKNNKTTPRILFKKRTSNGSGILPKGLANNIIKNEWMKRQMTDPYVALAKKNSLISRAAFKLINIDNDLKLFKAGQIVIDLGASPGGWSQYLRKVVTDSGLVISVDISSKFELEDKISFIHGDFTKIETQKQIKKMIQHKSLTNLREYKESIPLSDSFKIEKQKEERMLERLLDTEMKIGAEKNSITVDVVVSDMAPSYSGIQQLDHSRLIELQTNALEFTLKNLKKGGSFICKVSRGGEEKSFFKLLESNFLSVKSMKPEASRLESTEIYYIGKSFIGNIE